MEYLTIASDIRVAIRGFTKQADADQARFALLRKDSQKKILDSSSPKVRKAPTLDPYVWTLTIDEEVLSAAITTDEMQCGVFVSITAGGKTWSPPEQEYVIHRNKVTLVAKNDKSAGIAGARCSCAIRTPDDYTRTAVRGGGMAAPGRTRPSVMTVRTGADGKAILPLEAPGELDLVWEYPHYPKDQAAWVAQAGATRETVLLERERKSRFLWPEVAKGAEQKHYVNRLARPLSDCGRRLEIVVGIDRAVPGDRIILTVELASDDSKDTEGKPLKCDVNVGDGGGELEVGKPKKTLTLPLDSESGTRTVMLDFRGCGGITAKLGVSSVEGSTDETVSITSWRKVEIQPYHPVEGFFDGNTVPEALRTNVQKAFDPLFIEMIFLDSRPISSAFTGAEDQGQFAVVSFSLESAQAMGLDTGTRGDSAALVYYQLGRHGPATPDQWLGRPGAYANVLRANPQTTLHLMFSHGCYEAEEIIVSLSLAAGEFDSAPQRSTAFLPGAGSNAGDMVLPWSDGVPSCWKIAGEDTQGDVTADFIEIDREKAKAGICEFKLKLPEGAAGNPRQLSTDGKTIHLQVRLRACRFGAMGGGTHPLSYVGLPADYASARAAYTLIHELGHALGFAPPGGEFFYNVAGAHCANGMKSDADAYVNANRGIVGGTLGQTLATGVPGRNIPLELATLGKFGNCAMWGHAHRQMTTEKLFQAALKFCDTCAPLMRVTPIGARIGGEV